MPLISAVMTFLVLRLLSMLLCVIVLKFHSAHIHMYVHPFISLHVVFRRTHSKGTTSSAFWLETRLHARVHMHTMMLDALQHGTFGAFCWRGIQMLTTNHHHERNMTTGDEAVAAASSQRQPASRHASTPSVHFHRNRQRSHSSIQRSAMSAAHGGVSDFRAAFRESPNPAQVACTEHVLHCARPRHAA